MYSLYYNTNITEIAAAFFHAAFYSVAAMCFLCCTGQVVNDFFPSLALSVSFHLTLRFQFLGQFSPCKQLRLGNPKAAAHVTVDLPLSVLVQCKARIEQNRTGIEQNVSLGIYSMAIKGKAVVFTLQLPAQLLGRQKSKLLQQQWRQQYQVTIEGIQ